MWVKAYLGGNRRLVWDKNSGVCEGCVGIVSIPVGVWVRCM